ncbi:MAG TPA: E2/UBC family protein [Flavobacterium sp.]|uniref:ThiF family adenylyltransferase n=1 Tax=Flavobacterium sp. TaxID=239 RepID=UPI002C7AABE7|nr:ThiF family adenylyltransferase [Flavobacterium sp.]HNP31791.1 E2/UBC family protein [Flavobacterium sp.]
MDEFEEARLKAFDFIKSFESVDKFNTEQLKYYKLDRFVEAWKLRVEIIDESNKIIEVTIHICFKLDFPLSIPSLYLSSSDYEKLKYLPHIDTNRLICTFDSEVTKTDVSQPSKVVLECINRAKKIISEGIKKENFEDFEDEFLSYWECNYSKSDFVLNNFLNLIDPHESISSPLLINLKTKLGGFNYVIHNDNKISDKFKSHLKQQKIDFTEQSVFYFELEKKNFLPPFNFNNEEVIILLNSIDSNLVKQYESYLNNPTTETGLVLVNFKTKKNKVLIGWVNSPLTFNNKKGFRPNAIKPFEAISKFQRKDKVIRVLPETYTQSRLSMRTSGLIMQAEYKFLIVGIGSVGSHLISFLNSLNMPEFRLVDNDILAVENIGRHFLGFNSLKKYKTKGMKDYLNQLNPIQEIKTIEKSIIDVAINEISFLNETDYIFVATGKDNIDGWLFNSLKKGEILKPIFIIWVEPYLAGGHIIYLNPKNLIDYEKLFQDNHYKYNIIDNKYYNSPENTIALKEAGCQTTYIPYSSQNLMLFLAGIFPIITSIIVNSKLDSKIFTWIGDLDFLVSNKIDISDFASKNSFGEIIENHD